MKTIDINIARSDIDNELSKITAYTGAKSFPECSQEELDRVATVDEDAALLDRFWLNAAGILAEHLKDFISAASTAEGNISFTLEVSGAYDDSLTPSLIEGATAFVAASMVRSWFAITFPGKTTEWEAECMRLLREISRKLYHRRKPERH